MMQNGQILWLLNDAEWANSHRFYSARWNVRTRLFADPTIADRTFADEIQTIADQTFAD
jgi:hypothetical protein